MHIIIGFISAVAGLIWAINQLEGSGFQLSSFNPFYWFRKKRWQKKYQENSLHHLSDPIELVAVLLIGVAKLDGEISQEQKKKIYSIFHQDFSLTHDDASALFLSSSFLIQNDEHWVFNIHKILKKFQSKLTKEQVNSILRLTKKIASIDTPLSNQQKEWINAIKTILVSIKKDEKWN
jgi:uncharacterized tellurite resistance protein B-like protein